MENKVSKFHNLKISPQIQVMFGKLAEKETEISKDS